MADASWEIMVTVRVEDVTKAFGKVVAADGVTFDAKDGEFFTILGPSGCGKTTILRVIAGFYSPDRGRVLFDGLDVTGVPPYKRGTGMVFQNYALWPHMNVFENVAYGLKIRKLSSSEVKQRVSEALKLVRLEGYEGRMPHQLSGGEQQRVALARALVIEPKVLLLDEPLSNLDAKLRVSTRVEITKLQRRLRITTIYVTHDQEEALCISDTIAVMRNGRLVQVDAPRRIYEKPADAFVADFIGSSNILPAKVLEVDVAQALALVCLEDGTQIYAEAEPDLKPGDRAYVSFRPEATLLTTGHGPTPSQNVLMGKINVASFLGSITRYEVETGAGIIRVDISDPKLKHALKEGMEVQVSIPPSSCRILKIRD